MNNGLDDATIAAVVGADHADPFAVLGMHAVAGQLCVRAFVPGAETLAVIDPGSGETIADLARVHPDGLFAGDCGPRRDPFPYLLYATRSGGAWTFDDPYRFGPVLGEVDEYLLGEGSHHRAYERLGAHVIEHQGVAGTSFAVWAPGARRVSVVGDFNDWDGRQHAMRQRGHTGVWEIFAPGVGDGVPYKYEIKSEDGAILPLKADPFGFGAEVPPKTASVVRDIRRFAWSDDAWMSRRALANERAAPISIYEVHAGSWRRTDDDKPLTYEALAEELVPYVKDMGFTHIELLPISEHPFDGSWGYQPIGLFAPTSRYGSPSDFKTFVEACHRAGLGLILDWVPAHFPSDAHGLARFDGTHLYEHADARQGYHPDWHTLIFNYGRTEVAQYLLNNAIFWLDRYHIDGLRVDAVASMLYLDYSRKAGEWVPNKFGGNENLAAIAFLKRTNEVVYAEHPGIVTIAEESTAWPGVSQPTDAGGLGFGYKWNLGWMHDTLEYMGREPVHRKHHHHQMTFGIHYGFSENFILPLSHDEVVHGKGSLLSRMPGDTWQQFANLRALYTFMWTHPGKKLLFMGGEFAQGREWNYNASLDWHLLDIDYHRGVQALVCDLNTLYRQLPALHRLDCEAAGFAWLEANAASESVLAFVRNGGSEDAPAVVVCNFTPVPRERYRVGLPCAGAWTEKLNSDANTYRGSGLGNLGQLTAEDMPWHNQPYSAQVVLPPLAGIVLLPAD